MFNPNLKTFLSKTAVEFVILVELIFKNSCETNFWKILVAKDFWETQFDKKNSECVFFAIFEVMLVQT